MASDSCSHRSSSSSKRKVLRENVVFLPLPPTQHLQTLVKILINGFFQPARHLQTTTPACKGSHTPFVTNVFIHRNFQSFMHLHTTTFIHILATTAATPSPAKAGQVCTAGTRLYKAAFYPSPLTHTLTICSASLFPSPRGFQL